MTQIEDRPATAPVASTFSRSVDRIVRSLDIGGVTATSAYPCADPTDDALGDWWRSYLHGETLTPDSHRGEVRGLDLFCGPGGLALGYSQACAELGFDFVS